MPRIEWDKATQRTYETGVKNCVLYVQDSTGAYPKGVAWNGISSISENPTGADANDIYADDMKYLTLRAAETFEATVEAYTYPDEFAECDGTASPAPGLRLGQQTRKPFGIVYKTTIGNDTDFDDYGYKLHIIYNATVSPSQRSYQTINDSPEAITFSWDLTTISIPVDGYKATANLVIDSTKADETKLKALEDMLFGTESTEAHLPSPAEIIAALQ